MEKLTSRIKEVLTERNMGQMRSTENLCKIFTIVNPCVCNRCQSSPELQLRTVEILQVNLKDFKRIEKGELPRLVCFHNGIILIVICLKILLQI